MTNTAHIIDLVPADGDKKFKPTSRMATAIIDIIRETGDCQPHDLNAKGFTADEIAAHWRMASALAAVELTLTNDKPPRPQLPRRRRM